MTSPLSGMMAMPEQKPSKLQTIGAVLGGFGAGFNGQGQQYLANMEQQKQQLSTERQKAWVQDGMTLYQTLGKGDTQSAIALLDDRISKIVQLGGDPSDSLEAKELIAKGDIPAVMTDLEQFLGEAQNRGLLPAAQQIKPADLVDGALISNDPIRGLSATQITQPQQPKAPDSFRALEMRAAAAGLQPGTPEYQQFMAQSSSGVTVNVGDAPPDPYASGMEKFYEKSLEQVAELPQVAATSAGIAPQISILRQLVNETTEGRVGAILTRAFPTYNDANTAYMATVNQLLPSMRAPGSGAQSDRDIDVLREGLGSLASSREVRSMVLNSLQMKNEINQRKAEIANKMFAGELRPQEGIAQLRRIDQESILTPELQGMLNKVANTSIPPMAAEAGVTAEMWNLMPPEDRALWK